MAVKMGILQGEKIYIHTFVIISGWILLKMRNVAGKSCRENQNTLFMFNDPLLPKSCHEWDDVEQYGGATDDSIIWYMCFVCRITGLLKLQTHTK